jgi:hypothetical protein
MTKADTAEKLYHEWEREPTPDEPALDPQVILDTDDATADAYLWESHNSSEGWLQYDGELLSIRE